MEIMIRNFLILCAFAATYQAQAAINNYLIGTGIYDITGPAAEVNMFGYADTNQYSSGIRDRQWARAFIIGEPGKSPVVFVNVDQGAVFQGVNQAVVRGLRARFGDRYQDANVVISATHTHAAAGGHSHYALYDFTAMGYVEQTFNATVTGIVEAISRAHNNLAPGRVLFNRGLLFNANANRSIEAFNNNPEAEHLSATDNRMTVLKFVQGDNREVGMISWFATHGVSLPMNNLLLSSDNKGVAQLAFEAAKSADYGAQSFVAAFAQTAPGDMTPNLNLDGTGPGQTPEQSMQMIGQRQFEAAWQLYQDASEQLTGSVDFRQRYNDYANTRVEGAYTGQGEQRTCVAALGYSFAAGTEDGRGPLFEEGQREAIAFWEGVTALLTAPTQAQKDCHAPKPILLATGNTQPYPWTPEVLPVSILKLGQLGLLAVPGEFTITAGHRLEQTVARVADTGLAHLVVAGYADAYAGYVTTREEYEMQHYEGGSTHFGPWTLAAYQQTLAKLAVSLANPSSDPWQGEVEPVARDLIDELIPYMKPVVHDQAPVFKSIGDTVQDAHNQYAVGESVEVKFWSGHPRNDLKTMSSFLEVQQWQNGNWHTVARDRDNSTRYLWQRIDGFWGTSHAIIQWLIPEHTPPGDYRIVHQGVYKEIFSGRMVPYTGQSRSFRVE